MDTSNGAASPVTVFTGDLTTGFFQAVSGDGTVGIASVGVEVGRFDSGGLILPNGTAAAPSLSFTGNGADGIYWIASGRYGFATEGTLGVEIWDDWIYANTLDLTGSIDVDVTATVRGAFWALDDTLLDGNIDLGTWNAIGATTTPSIADATLFSASVAGEITDFTNVAIGEIYIVAATTTGVSFQCDGTELHCGDRDEYDLLLDEVSFWAMKGSDHYMIAATPKAPMELIFRTESSIVNGPDDGTDCLMVDRYGYLSAGACTNNHVTTWVAPRDYTVAETLVILKTQGDSGAKCQITLEDTAGTAHSGAPVLNFNADATIRSVALTDTTEYTIAKNDNIRFEITAQPTYACTGALDPTVLVEIWGRPSGF
jgi:hypothetical protein